MDDYGSAPPGSLRREFGLAERTTLEVGGPARCWLEADDESTLIEGLRWARELGLPATLLGGGSNVVVSDAGVDGLVIGIALRGYELRRGRDRSVLSVAAGEPWDSVVERSLEDGLVGLECLSGIPGTAGATPIQNVGAYGREIGDLLLRVRLLDRSTLAIRELEARDLELGYRSSRLRREPDRYVVMSLSIGFSSGARPEVGYPELRRLLEVGDREPTPRLVREAVLELRRSKSMVIEPGDPNRRSVGSFFVNPVLDAAAAAGLQRTASDLGIGDPPPLFPIGSGRHKASAAWLIEHAGFAKGSGPGRVGLSTRHCLALVNRGGARAAEVVDFARVVRRAVHDRFGIRLRPEPVFLGFATPNPLAED